MKTAFLFPGQGAQFVGMGRGLAEADTGVASLFRQADSILGFELSRIMFEGPEEALRETRNTQPAIFLHSIAVLRALGARPGEDFQCAAGHSLGEYSAYVAAGSLAFEDALRLVRKRGELMFQAGIERPGTMAAILGLEGEALRAALETVPGVVVPANENSPGQVVISGEVGAVETAMERCKEAGAKRTIRLEVSGAFHSPLMDGAANGLRAALADTKILASRVPVYANATAMPVTDPEGIRESLSRQLLAPVRWEGTVRAMLAAGVGRFVEVGPGKVLTGLTRAIDRTAASAVVGTPAEIAVYREGGAS